MDIRTKDVMKSISFVLFVMMHFDPHSSNAAELPKYWLCDGVSHQSVRQTGGIEKTYSGHEPVLLEVYQNHVFQVFSPALSGAYLLCPSPKKLIVFRRNSCDAAQQERYERHGSLDLQTGQLFFEDKRQFNSLDISSEGHYLCRYLGHSYDFVPFNHVDTKK
jgi:hypothetical protein